MYKYHTANKETPLTVRFNKPFYEKYRIDYVPMIINVDAAKAFLGKDADVLTTFLKNRFPTVRKAEYKIRYESGDVGYTFFLETDRELTGEETGMLEISVEEYQRKMAEKFNAQVFTMSEYGIVRFPANAACQLETA